jgi:putative Ig domain-containing protein
MILPIATIGMERRRYEWGDLVNYRQAVPFLCGLIGLLHAACVPGVCGQRCGVDGQCPSGSVCGSDGLYCAPVGDADACGVGASGSGGTAAGAAGQAGSEAGAASSGGSDMSAGVDAGPIGEVPLRMQVEALSDVCVGDRVIVELAAAGGTGSAYGWRLVEAADAFEPRQATGERFTVQARLSSAGPVELVVALTDGSSEARERVTLLVHEAPRVLMEALPPVCPGELYEAALSASGGDASSYEWSAAGAPSGLSIEGDRLVGHFTGSSAAPPTTIELSVRAQGCSGEPRPLSLEVLPAGSESCPEIQALTGDGEPLAALPPPCLGSEYAQTLSVRQANSAPGSHVWEAITTPPGLAFDPDSATLHGTPLGEGSFQVRVTDEAGRSVEVTYPVTPREHCWFAHVAQQVSPARLRLLDARLPEQAAARRSFPADDSTGDVLDFAFSPDGRLLAYRVQVPSAPAQLRLLDLRSWQERTLDFDGSVSAYAWARSESAGAVLAVAFAGAEDERLGGVTVPGIERQSDADPLASALDGLIYLQPAAALVRSELFSFDEGRFAFLTSDPIFEPGRLLQAARFESGVVTALARREALEFFDGAHFAPGRDGVFVVEPSTGSPNFYASNGAREVIHAFATLVSPSGAYTARALDGQLQVFRASDESSNPSVAALATGAGCTSLLGWASGRERIACARAADGNQRVVFFDLVEAPLPALEELARVQGDYTYLSGQHVERPRLFADGAGRFAFTTDDDVYVVQLDDGTPRIDLSVPVSVLGAPPGQLSFSPGATFLSVHAGSGLLVWNLGRSDKAGRRLPFDMPDPSGCGEDVFEQDPAWCGAPARDAITRWSTDEDLLAYRNRAGALQIEDLTLGFPTDTRTILVDESCSSDCVAPTGYAFQP